MADASTHNVRTRVTESCLEALSAEESLDEEFVKELRVLLEEAKPPKADSFVAVFEKRTEGESA